MQSRHCKHWKGWAALSTPALTGLTGSAVIKERPQKRKVMLRCRGGWEVELGWIGSGYTVYMCELDEQ